MKKYLVIIFVIFTVGIFYAHSPSDIKFTYDSSTDPAKSTLTVYIKHNINASGQKDPTKHYIKEVELKVNGKAVDTQTFTQQETADGQTVVFKVNLTDKDKVSVKATCNMIGAKTSNFTLPKS
jgi:desulfoferrodoxin (superoxide reductase-like protein)